MQIFFKFFIKIYLLISRENLLIFLTNFFLKNFFHKKIFAIFFKKIFTQHSFRKIFSLSEKISHLQIFISQVFSKTIFQKKLFIEKNFERNYQSSKFFKKILKILKKIPKF